MDNHRRQTLDHNQIVALLPPPAPNIIRNIPDIQFHRGPMVDLHPLRGFIPIHDLWVLQNQHIIQGTQMHQGPIVDLHPARVLVPADPNAPNLPQPNL